MSVYNKAVVDEVEAKLKGVAEYEFPKTMIPLIGLPERVEFAQRRIIIKHDCSRKPYIAYNRDGFPPKPIVEKPMDIGKQMKKVDALKAKWEKASMKAHKAKKVALQREIEYLEENERLVRRMFGDLQKKS